MKIQVTIHSPKTIQTEFSWPQGVPYPSAGDLVILRGEESSWVFRVQERTLDIGIDPRNMEPLTQIFLQVDAEAPPGFRYIPPRG